MVGLSSPSAFPCTYINADPFHSQAATRTHKIAAVTPKPAAQTVKPVAAPPTIKPESPTTHSQPQPAINTASADSESQSAAAKGVDGTTATTAATNGGPVPIVPVQENAESDGESTSRTVRIIMGLGVLNLAIGMILCGIGVYVCVKRRKDGEREMEGGAAYAQVENMKAGETVFDAKYESHEEQV